MKHWGKLIGGFLGFSLGGPLGALLGMTVGHVHDAQEGMVYKKSKPTGYSGFRGTEQQVTFTVGVIVLGAKMAKVDGRVTRAEIDAFKRVFRVTTQQMAHVGRVFDEARKSAEGYETHAQQLAQTFRHNPTVLEEILGGLFMIAAADGAPTPTELRFLQSVAVIFAIPREDFYRVAARAGVMFNNGYARSEAPAAKPRDESYIILGVSETATHDEVKTAYRTLTRKYHPDQLMAQGLPPEYVETASEKMKRINVAYDTICKARGFK